jgi:NADH-quinone oxidoreductase subunit C
VTDVEATDGDEAAGPAAAPEPERLHGALVDESRGQATLHTTVDGYRALVEALHADGYAMCVDLTVVDYLTHPGRSLPAGVDAERFEVVVGLLDLQGRRRQRIRVQLPADDPSLPTLWDLYPGTEAMEREAYDMFGVTFTGHPDMTRILMPDDWDGHPLRKDAAPGRIPVQFKAVEGR